MFSDAILGRGTDATARRNEADRLAIRDTRRAAVRSALAKAAKAAGTTTPPSTA